MDIFKEIDEPEDNVGKRTVRSVDDNNEFVSSSSTDFQILEKSDNIITFTSKSKSKAFRL